MKLYLLSFLAISYLFWIHFLVFASYKGAVDAKRGVPKVTLILIAPPLLTGLLIDVSYNLTFGCLLFLELPRTWTLTSRCDSHLKETTWRGSLARWFCSNLLDPFQAGGHCK
jgi:hypothetical protein